MTSSTEMALPDGSIRNEQDIGISEETAIRNPSREKGVLRVWYPVFESPMTTINEEFGSFWG